MVLVMSDDLNKLHSIEWPRLTAIVMQNQMITKESVSDSSPVSHGPEASRY